MKKTMIILSAALALIACNKITPEVKNNEAVSTPKLVFEITVNNADATKGVKTDWENGDVVYAFFQDNTSQYVKMTYNGTSWDCTDKYGGSEYTDLTLEESGKKVSAVYFPDYVGSESPTWSTNKWTFGTVSGYYQTAAADYTAETVEDVTTVSATLSLEAPVGITQLYVPDTEYTAPETGNEYVLTATHVSPYTFAGIVPGQEATYDAGTRGFPLTAYEATIGGEAGYYFWGILEGAGTYDFDFQLVKRNAEKKYAISSKSKSVKSLTVSTSFAGRLRSFTDKGNFVSLGYSGGPLWATGNLVDNGTIADPLVAGDMYKWGATTPYDMTGQTDPYEDYTYTDDFKDTAKDKNSKWSMPTKEQFEALISGSNTDNNWETGWTNIGTVGGGRLFTSRVNGIKIFLAAVGMCHNGQISYAGYRDYYWTSTTINISYAYTLIIDQNSSMYNHNRYIGSSVRPVIN